MSINNNASDDIKQILITQDEISQKVHELGTRITSDYINKNLLMIRVLKGSVIFMADLMRAVNIPLRIDFLSVASYGNKSVSGEIKFLKDLDNPVDGYDILIVEDILDSGLTLSYIMGILKVRNAQSIEICTLLDKPERHKTELYVKYKGFVIPDEFVVGYGLDYAEKYRNLPYIGVLKSEIYKQEWSLECEEWS